jgi:hypothetical protein
VVIIPFLSTVWLDLARCARLRSVSLCFHRVGGGYLDSVNSGSFVSRGGLLAFGRSLRGRRRGI